MNTRTPLAWMACVLAVACAEPSQEKCFRVSQSALYAAPRVPVTVHLPLTQADVVIDRIEPLDLLPGSPIHILGANLTGEHGTIPEVVLEGEFTGDGGGPARPVALVLPVSELPDGAGLAAQVDGSFLAALGDSRGTFEGHVTVTTVVGDPPMPVSSALRWPFALYQQLEPLVTDINLGDPNVYPADRVTVDGDGFLLPGEGQSLLVLTGEFYPEAGGNIVPVSQTIPLEAATDRRTATFVLEPEVLGPQPGELVNGQVTVLNRTESGLELEAPAPTPLVLHLLPPFVSGFSPNGPSRGQRVTVRGRGFLSGGRTIIRLDGRFYPFHPVEGELDPVAVSGTNVTLDRWIDNGQLEFSLLTERDDNGDLLGLAANPGRFEGMVTPYLLGGGTEVRGIPWTDGFRIAPTKQIVWVKFLPTFNDALDTLFGLRSVAPEIQTRVLEVAHRDYARFNIEFRLDRPDDFLEFSIIEIGGPDVNNAGLFGLDNTDGKDTGNLRLDDIVGGRNAASGLSGYYAFGGVFIESFIAFSPAAPEPLPIASPEFDRIFGPFAPTLCGSPVVASEAGNLTSSARGPQVQDAIRVMGNLVGNTVVHEIGHSLGLSQAVPSEFDFHNQGDNGNIMDAGTDRSFDERAELTADGANDWHSINTEYLRNVLPRPPEDGR